MKFLPFENITYHTQLSGTEVIKRLSENLEPRDFSLVSLLDNRKTYRGSIEKNSFNIRRKDRRINLFIPTVKGEFWEDSTRTTMKIKIRLNTFVIIFTTAWIVSLLIQLGIEAVTSLETLRIPFLIIPFLVIIFGYVLTTVMFKYESIGTKRHLAKLFEAKIENTSKTRYKK